MAVSEFEAEALQQAGQTAGKRKPPTTHTIDEARTRYESRKADVTGNENRKRPVHGDSSEVDIDKVYQHAQPQPCAHGQHAVSTIVIHHNIRRVADATGMRNDR